MKTLIITSLLFASIATSGQQDTIYTTKDKYCSKIIEYPPAGDQGRRVTSEATFGRTSHIYFGFEINASGEKQYFLVAFIGAAADRYYGDGLTIIFADGRKIERPEAKVEPAQKGDVSGFKHSATVEITKEEFQILCETEVTEIQLHIMQGWPVPSQQKSYIEQAKCIWSKY